MDYKHSPPAGTPTTTNTANFLSPSDRLGNKNKKSSKGPYISASRPTGYRVKSMGAYMYNRQVKEALLQQRRSDYMRYQDDISVLGKRGRDEEDQEYTGINSRPYKRIAFDQEELLRRRMMRARKEMVDV